MIDYKSMFEKETVSDIIAFFAGKEKGIGYPQLDNFFVRYRFDAVGTGNLLKTFEDMSKVGTVKLGGKMLVTKGPNWKAPKFMTDKKYGIV